MTQQRALSLVDKLNQNNVQERLKSSPVTQYVSQLQTEADMKVL